MDETKAQLPVEIVPDKKSLDAFDKIMDSFKKVKPFDTKNINKAKAQFDKFNESKSKINDLRSTLSDYRDAKGKGDAYSDRRTRAMIKEMKQVAGKNKSLKGELGSSDTSSTSKLLGEVKKNIASGLKKVADNFLEGLKSVFKNAWKEAGTMLQSSLLSNANTRENAFSYGFSSSESYGFDKAKQMLGIESEEDLMYMNDPQKAKFEEVMTKYATKYSEMYDSGFFDKYLDFQIEMQEFKLDMEMEIIEFFMQNKDTIKKFLELSMKAMEFIVESLGWIMDKLGNSTETSDVDKVSNINDIISGYTTNNNSSTQIKQEFNNNNNFSGTPDSQQRAFADMIGSESMSVIASLGGLVK